MQNDKNIDIRAVSLVNGKGTRVPSTLLFTKKWIFCAKNFVDMREYYN